MAYEIDFMPVGDGERSGDAIALRCGNFATRNGQMIMVLDGGTKDSGAALVRHIQKFYGTSDVDFVFCTHSDTDHASGLTEVLENLNVKVLYMHRPWNHVQDLENELAKAPASDTARQHFRKSLENAHELERIAIRRGIRIVEPFSDTVKPNPVFTVLGPSQAYYERLLRSFRCADELSSAGKGIFAKIAIEARKVAKWIAESWGTETLLEPGEDACSAENNSSVILLFTPGNFLFTSDAGVSALTEADDLAAVLGIDLTKVANVQVPHHGSKNNVGPTILDRIIGPRLKEQRQFKQALVSAAPHGDPKHPSRRVVNAFKRRGAAVFATQGTNLWHHSPDAPYRGWGNAIELPFNDNVEE